jgi:hypothetical protein
MIEHLRDALTATGLVGTGQPLYFNIYTGRTCVVQVFVDDRLGFVAKLGKPGSVEPEYRTTARTAAALGDLVPEPLLFQRTDSLEIAIWRGVEHMPIDPRRWSRRQVSAVRHGLALYMERGLSGLSVDDHVPPHASTLDQALTRVRAALPHLDGFLPDGLAGGDAINRLPHVWQHGDFWYGNLGLCGNSLVVFDWEDFGEVTLHGHDIAVFLASTLNFAPRTVKILFDTGKPSYLDGIISDFCRPLGMDREDFVRLFPAFLVVFLDLKLQRDYGGLVIRLMADLLEGLHRHR